MLSYGASVKQIITFNQRTKCNSSEVSSLTHSVTKSCFTQQNHNKDLNTVSTVQMFSILR